MRATGHGCATGDTVAQQRTSCATGDIVAQQGAVLRNGTVAQRPRCAPGRIAQSIAPSRRIRHPGLHHLVRAGVRRQRLVAQLLRSRRTAAQNIASCCATGWPCCRLRVLLRTSGYSDWHVTMPVGSVRVCRQVAQTFVSFVERIAHPGCARAHSLALAGKARSCAVGRTLRPVSRHLARM